ncbi:MAG: ribosome biogenesis GTPase Der [Patescibacteria group bacterium]
MTAPKTKKKRSGMKTVVLVGRTNVGKSTLFNRLIEQKKAVESSTPKTTRDINRGECLWRGNYFRVVDTGGFVERPREEIDVQVARHASKAIADADAVLFLVDVKEGLNPLDRAYLGVIRKISSAPTFLVANKADGARARGVLSDPQWLKLGLSAPHPVSAMSGVGVGDLLDAITSLWDWTGEQSATSEPIRVAIVGRTNVGKSSLLNKIIGEERVIVSSVPHTTREPQDMLIERGGRQYLVIDTVGMRKKSRVKERADREGLIRSIEVIHKADCVILVLDATVTLAKHESRLAQIAVEEGAGLLLVVNKWDLVEEKKSKSILAYEAFFRERLAFVPWAPLLFVSALTAQRTGKILESIDSVEQERSKILSPDEALVFLKKAMSKQKPQWIFGKKKPMVYGFFQRSARPPMFILEVREADAIQYGYLRYLENRLREQFGFQGTPIRIATEQVIKKLKS